MLHFVNVLDYADAGKVDPHSPEDGSFDNLDLRHIRRFVQLDIRLRTQVKKTVGYGRTIPSIARQVLVSFWEEPRTGFHYKEIEGLKEPVDFGSKRLDVPWSEKAYLRFKKKGCLSASLMLLSCCEEPVAGGSRMTASFANRLQVEERRRSPHSLLTGSDGLRPIRRRRRVVP